MTDKKTSPKQNNLLYILIAVAVVVICGYSFLNSDLKHIEDANGPEDYTLTTITDENIIKQDMGALNVSKSTGLLNDGVTFKSDKFTGVYRVFQTNFFFDSDFLMDVAAVKYPISRAVDAAVSVCSAVAAKLLTRFRTLKTTTSNIITGSEI